MDNQVSLSTRIKMWWDQIPLLSKSLFVFCCIIFVVQSLFNQPSTQAVCYSYYMIMSDPVNLYRILTAPFFHVTILHIIFNMFALMSLGVQLERKMGTFHLLVCTIWIILLCAAFEFGITLVAHQVLPRIFDLKPDSYVGSIILGMIFECGVGFSGVLFAYLTMGIHYQSDQQQQSLFGLMLVPSLLYPWILLFVTQLLMAGVSFMAHMSGIIAAYILTFIFIRRAFWNRHVQWLESKLVPAFIRNHVSFTSTIPSSDSQMAQQVVQQQQQSNSSAGGHVLGSTVTTPSFMSRIGQAWTSFKETVQSGWSRVTQASPFASTSRENRQYGRLDEEEEDLELQQETSVDEQQRPNAAATDVLGTFVELPPLNTEQQQPAPRQQPQQAPTSPTTTSNNIRDILARPPRHLQQQQQQQTPTDVKQQEEYFNNLKPGRKLNE